MYILKVHTIDWNFIRKKGDLTHQVRPKEFYYIFVDNSAIKKMFNKLHLRSTI